MIHGTKYMKGGKKKITKITVMPKTRSCIHSLPRPKKLFKKTETHNYIHSELETNLLCSQTFSLVTMKCAACI